MKYILLKKNKGHYKKGTYTYISDGKAKKLIDDGVGVLYNPETGEELQKKTSTDMKAKEAIQHIHNSDLEELNDFIDEDEERITVISAYKELKDESDVLPTKDGDNGSTDKPDSSEED